MGDTARRPINRPFCWLVSYMTLAITPAPPRQTRAQCTIRSAHCCCERLPPSPLQSDSGTCHHRTYTLLPATPHMSATGAMRCASVLLLLAAARALTPLPPGINAYEVAAGTRNRPAEALAPVALRAIAAAREANVKLGEIEFPALLGEKTAFDDVDNVQICAVMNRHRHAIEQASRRWRGGRRDDSAGRAVKF